MVQDERASVSDTLSALKHRWTVTYACAHGRKRESSAAPEAKPRASGRVDCPFRLKLQRSDKDASQILVTESVWHDRHDSIITRDNL